MDRPRGQIVGPLLSVILGVLSVALLLRLTTGIPAIVIGFLCLRLLNASDGTNPSSRTGRRLAIAGMVLGAAGSVLGIVGIVSLLLNRAAEASRRMTCVNHQRQLGIAVNLYHDVMSNTYPSATVDGPWGLAGFAPWLGEPYVGRLGWLVNVLPFLDKPQSDPKAPGPYLKLIGTMNASQGWRGAANEEAANTTVRNFLCPSHPFYEPGQKPAVSHYVGITGLDPHAVELSLSQPNVGFFGYERRLRTGQNLPNPLPKGQGYTLLAAETMLDNGPWIAGNRSTLRGIEPSTRPYVGYNRPFGGMHPGGVNLLLADGAVEFFSERGNPEILERMARLTLEEEVP